jgi:hypothetical protein
VSCGGGGGVLLLVLSTGCKGGGAVPLCDTNPGGSLGVKMFMDAEYRLSYRGSSNVKIVSRIMRLALDNFRLTCRLLTSLECNAYPPPSKCVPKILTEHYILACSVLLGILLEATTEMPLRIETNLSSLLLQQ